MDKFTKDTTLTFVAKIIILLIGLITSVIIARYLGPQGKGIFAMSLLLPYLIIIFTNFGIGPATVYYVGKKRYEIGTAIGNNFVLSIIISLISVGLGILIIVFFKNVFFQGISDTYLYLSLIIIPVNIIWINFQSIILGIQNLKKFNIAEIFNKSLILIFICVIFFILSLGIEGAIISHFLALLIAVIIIYSWLNKLTARIDFKLNRDYVKEISLYGTKAYFSNILAFLNYRFDIFLINLFLNPTAVGYYTVSVAIVEKLWLVSSSASTVLFPRVSAETDEKRRKEFTPKVARNVLIITLIGAIIGYYLSSWIVVFLYSDAYLDSVLPFQILLIGIICLSVAKVLSHDIAGRGKPIINTYMAIVTVICNIVLNIYWIPKYGITGAAMASTCAYFLQFIGKLLIYIKISGNSFKDVLILKKSDILKYREICIVVIDKYFRRV